MKQRKSLTARKKPYCDEPENLSRDKSVKYDPLPKSTGVVFASMRASPCRRGDVPGQDWAVRA